MIQTKHLFFFCASLLGLSVLIGLTILFRPVKNDVAGAPVSQISQDGFSVVAQKDHGTDVGFLENMRSRLGLYQPPTLDETPVENEEPPEIVAEATSMYPLLCESRAHHPLVEEWPSGEVVIEEVEGARLVALHAESVVSGVRPLSGTTSSPIIPVRQVLFQFPSALTRETSDYCAPQGLIGFRSDGGLIFNRDVILYQNTPATELIGYTIDGFPLYGPTSEETDTCGGRLTERGYQYHVHGEGEYILECLGAPPADFLI